MSGESEKKGKQMPTARAVWRLGVERLGQDEKQREQEMERKGAG